MIAIDLLKDCFDAVMISSVVLLHKLSKLHRKTLVLVLALLIFLIYSRIVKGFLDRFLRNRKSLNVLRL